jgi:hypothetical protein
MVLVVTVTEVEVVEEVVETITTVSTPILRRICASSRTKLLLEHNKTVKLNKNRVSFPSRRALCRTSFETSR